MNNPRLKLFGMSPKALVITFALGIALMLVFSIWIGLLPVVIISGVIQYRNYRAGRPEAAYEVTENGTGRKRLWIQPVDATQLNPAKKSGLDPALTAPAAQCIDGQYE